MIQKALITGANGFVGRALCERLQERFIDHVPAVRCQRFEGEYQIGDISADADWSPVLKDCDVVVHLAARVHVMNDRAVDPLAAFRAINLNATVNLARQAARHNVRRFVFVSSIKVNGEITGKAPFTALDTPAPQDAYGQSKLEAELALQQISRETGLEVVIIRPPLVYGPGVGANFLRLMRLVQKGIPLPLGAVRNLRSLVALDNLVDLLIACVGHPAAAGKTFLVSDDHDVSTPELVRMLATAMGRQARLLPVPVGCLRAGATLLGKSAAADRLLGSLQVDIRETRSVLGWEPVVGTEEAIGATVAHFLSHA